MKTTQRIARSLLAAVLATGAIAAQAADVTVKDAWIRATVPQQQATGAFMHIEASEALKLVGARSTLTPSAEVHEMSMQDGVMKMKQVHQIDVAPGKPLDLAPGGYHVMLMNLKQQVKVGDQVPLTLVFEKKDGTQQEVDLKVEVRPLNTPAKSHGKGAHGH